MHLQQAEDYCGKSPLSRFGQFPGGHLIKKDLIVISDRGWEKILNSDAPIRGRRDAMPPASHGHPSVVILAKRSVRLSRVRVGSMCFRRRTRIPAASHPGDTSSDSVAIRRPAFSTEQHPNSAGVNFFGRDVINGGRSGAHLSTVERHKPMV